MPPARPFYEAESATSQQWRSPEAMKAQHRCHCRCRIGDIVGAEIWHFFITVFQHPPIAEELEDIKNYPVEPSSTRVYFFKSFFYEMETQWTCARREEVKNCDPHIPNRKCLPMYEVQDTGQEE